MEELWYIFNVINTLLSGSTILYNCINETYWSTGRLIVGSITGKGQIEFIKWLKHVNKTQTHYNLFNIYVSWDNSPGDLLFESRTCADFVWNAFESLHNSK
jgi:hypothetical protein